MTTPTTPMPETPTVKRVPGTGVPPTYHLWLIAGSILTLGVLALFTVHVVSLLAHEVVTETKTVPAAGINLLDVRNADGRVEVVGGDVDEITVTAKVSHGLRPTRYRVAVEGDAVVVRSSCPLLSTWCGVDQRIVIPSDLAVRASSSNGQVILEDLTGPVNASSNNGAVELTRLSGDLTLRSDNGRVDGKVLESKVVVARSANGFVRLQFAEPPTDVTATSSNGYVDVVLPDTEVAFKVVAESSNGGTDIGVRTDPSSDRTITATSANGHVEVRYPTG
jgi:DUF4097 and DUF4098 domain-containing protein YvlB